MDATGGGQLEGVTVLVAGAGLAGLTAARDLTAMGAQVTVVDARDRVGGRVHTIRQGFSSGQHAEAGADFIDEDHHEVRALVAELGLKLVRVLRGGWGFAEPDPRGGRTRIARPGKVSGWERLAASLRNLIRHYRLAELRWDTPIAADIARHSVGQWLRAVNADEGLRATAIGLRGFFLADPDDLSLLALVDQFAADESHGPEAMYRIEGGNDRLPEALAAPLGDRLKLGTELVAVSRRGRRVRASLTHKKQAAQLQVDYAVLALPTPLLRRIPITPALPAQQHDAISRLRYGKATKTLLQFSRRSWRASVRARGLGSALPVGALWDANEEQQGRNGILALVAGGAASDLTRELFAKEGIDGLVRAIDWLGVKRDELMSWRQTVWEADGLARGGYAYFDPGFDPSLRAWLARPAGPLFFAGEHTSFASQGYMNGAVESGRRAAAEIVAAHRLTVRADL
jgi:monoamine oxidase